MYRLTSDQKAIVAKASAVADSVVAGHAAEVLAAIGDL